MQDIAMSFLGVLTGLLQRPEDFPEWLFTGTLVIWLIFSGVLAYHWFKYNLGSAFTPIALFVYIFGSFILIGYTASGL